MKSHWLEVWIIFLEIYISETAIQHDKISYTICYEHINITAE